MTKPFRNFKDALGDLREKSGLDDVIGGLKGVGSGVMDVLGKIAMIGGIAAAADAGLLSLVGGFDDLGDKAEALGVSVDWLAQMRYAAERSGVEIQDLDGSMRTFVAGVGQARAGTGKLAGFLKIVSPALLKQVKAAKSNEEAFALLADAMAKLEDPAKRAALATGPSAMLRWLRCCARRRRGSKSSATLYRPRRIAGGPQRAAGATDDALKDLHAATDGVKAALVEGLAPALTDHHREDRDWLKVGHRGDVKEWAASLGKKIPAAFDKLVDSGEGCDRFPDAVLRQLDEDQDRARRARRRHHRAADLVDRVARYRDHDDAGRLVHGRDRRDRSDRVRGLRTLGRDHRVLQRSCGTA
jgi:hypothetical protein